MATNNRRKKSGFAEVRRTLHGHLEFTAKEQYKLLRTNLSFTIPAEVKCPIIGLTSANRGEGKSTTAINLSYVLAESGKRVLLIDGDMRVPSIAKKMELEAAPGLSNLLMEQESLDLSIFRSTVLNNWYVVPSGELPPNPSELLGSRRMENLLRALAEKFDYIVVDLPPVNLVSDALAISKFITGMIVVVKEDHTEKRELEQCYRQLSLTNVKVLGCVMNNAKTGRDAYGDYHDYDYEYGYGYGYGRRKKKND
jgi:capsular exopolysaccharide synthesis family protein